MTATPMPQTPRDRSAIAAQGETLLEINNLQKYFPIRGGLMSRVVANVKAVDDVSFRIGRGEVVGLIGESGSGKTTAGRALLRLIEPTGGPVLFIAHDLHVVEYICDRMIVMYLGRIMEVAPSHELNRNPKHPYTEALLSASPIPDPTVKRQRIILEGDIPSPINPPSGCVFRTRCRYAIQECANVVPELREVSPGHFKACIRDDIL